MTNEIQILNEIEKAALLCEKEYTHQELLNVIKTEDDFEKQICIMKLQKLCSQEEANLLVFQLTGHASLIRETTAIKIHEFVSENKYLELFLTNEILNSLLNGINDINPNICRLICSVIKILFENNKKEKEIFLNNLYKRFDEIFADLEQLKRSRLYTKKLFNLYWSLEALAMLTPQIDETFENIIEKSSKVKDYTIREKTAMVLSSLSNTSTKIEEIKKTLKNDENFYVKRYSKLFE